MRLAIGVLVSMFTAVVVTRTLLRTLIGTRLARQIDLLGPNLRPPDDGVPARSETVESEA